MAVKGRAGFFFWANLKRIRDPETNEIAFYRPGRRQRVGTYPQHLGG